MPVPLSLTTMVVCCRSCRTSMITRPPGELYLIALSNKFAKPWLSRLRSAMTGEQWDQMRQAFRNLTNAAYQSLSKGGDNS